VVTVTPASGGPVKVNANWRMIFAFDGEDAILVDYLDYH
jgi:proteic killer suppression protein